MDSGMVGSIVGPVVGIAGGVVGCYFGIKSTIGPRERAFMIRSVAVCWICIGVLLAGLLLFPQARLWLFGVYCILLPVGILYGNKKHRAIRAEEQAKT